MKALPKEVREYLNTLKLNKRNETYETLLLMSMDNEFVDILKGLILKSIKSTEVGRGKLKFSIFSSQKYEETVERIAYSKYFKDNFERGERDKKIQIIKNIIFEIVTNEILKSALSDFDSTWKNVNVNTHYENIDYPLIEHTPFIGNSVRKIKLTFPYSTTKSELFEYIDKNLNLRPASKKKKMSLGQGLRLLEIEEEIQNQVSKEGTKKYEYIEQLIARKLLERYGEKMSVEAIKKLIQRTKKIISQINE